jgi:hypothetical protein
LNLLIEFLNYRIYLLSESESDEDR